MARASRPGGVKALTMAADSNTEESERPDDAYRFGAGGPMGADRVVIRRVDRYENPMYAFAAKRSGCASQQLGIEAASTLVGLDHRVE